MPRFCGHAIVSKRRPSMRHSQSGPTRAIFVRLLSRCRVPPPFTMLRVITTVSSPNKCPGQSCWEAWYGPCTALYTSIHIYIYIYIYICTYIHIYTPTQWQLIRTQTQTALQQCFVSCPSPWTRPSSRLRTDSLRDGRGSNLRCLVAAREDIWSETSPSCPMIYLCVCVCIHLCIYVVRISSIRPSYSFPG